MESSSHFSPEAYERTTNLVWEEPENSWRKAHAEEISKYLLNPYEYSSEEELKKAIEIAGFELKEAHHNVGINSYSLLRFRTK